MIDRNLIAFRVDASTAIGAGHVMRCLSLSQALTRRGASVVFVSRSLPLQLRNQCRALGIEIADLGVGKPPQPSAEAPHAHWLGADTEADAAETRAHFVGQTPAWLVVDHYAIDARWQSLLRPHVGRIAVIDDLADRKHDCDLLIDANITARPDRRYLSLTPDSAALCLGPRHAMLRPEFAAKAAEVRGLLGPVNRILVSFGGFDNANLTLHALRALDHVKFPGGVDVVIGRDHPAEQRIAAYVGARPKWSLHVQTTRMAELMASADFSVGAGGITVYERACLGLPALAICAAENQRNQLCHAETVGILKQVSPEGLTVEDLSRLIASAIANPEVLQQQSRKGRMLVDGRGADRLAGLLTTPDPVTVRPARREDAVAVLEWRNAEAVRKQSGNTDPIPLESHKRWFDGKLASPACLLLIGLSDGVDCGVVRFDIEGDSATVSIFLSPAFLGKGIGLNLLLVAERTLFRGKPEVTSCIARVNIGNTASERMFFAAGYDKMDGHWRKGI